MRQIPANEIVINPTSYTDPSGNVFMWRDRIFRGIVKEQANYFRQLVDSEVVKRLQDRGMLIDSKVSPETLDMFDLVIEHRRIQYISYCFEWTPEMLKEAALLTLNTCFEILDKDLILQDAYPWNILFEGPTPIFIDIGSFVPIRKDMLWVAYEQFCNFFLYPLYLYSMGLYEIAHPLLLEYLSGITTQKFFKLLPLAFKIRHPVRYPKLAVSYHLARLINRFGVQEKIKTISEKTYRTLDAKRSRKKFIESLINEVESIRLHVKGSHWSSYYDHKVCSYNKEDFMKKETIVRAVINKYQPKTILDVGSNTGFYSILGAKNGSKVVSVDSDEACISKLYMEVKRTGDCVLPLVIDILNPSPAFGWCCKQFPSAIDRLKADMVFAFAIVHHLSITCRQGFKRILDTLDSFANNYVLLEFVSAKDPKVKSLIDNSLYSYPWYSLENLKKELYSRHRQFEIFEPHSPWRQFILYEK